MCRGAGVTVFGICPSCGGYGWLICMTCRGSGVIIGQTRNDPNQGMVTAMALMNRIVERGKEIATLYPSIAEYQDKGELESAKEGFDRLIELYRIQFQDTLGLGQHAPQGSIAGVIKPLTDAMLMESDLLESLANLEQVDHLRNEALDLSKQYLSPSEIKNNERWQARLFASHGLYNEALSSLSAVRDFFEQQREIIGLGESTQDMANILLWLGDYERGLSELEHAEEIIAPLLQGRSLSQLDTGTIANTIKKALSFGKTGNMQEAKNLAETRKYHDLLLRILDTKALAYKRLGRFEEAESLYNKYLPEYQNLGTGTAAEFHLADIMIKKGKYSEGLASAERLEDAFMGNGIIRPKFSSLLRMEAESLLNLGRPEEALEKSQQGIDDLASYSDPETLWNLQWIRGRALNALDKNEDALEAYSEAIKTVNNLRKAPLGFRLDSTSLKDKFDLFVNAIDLACKINSPENCCEFIEMIKSRTLTVILSIPQDRQIDGSNEDEKRIDELTREIDGIEYMGYMKKITEELDEKRKKLQDERASLLEKIRFSDPRWRSISEPVPFALDKITDVLSDIGFAAINLFYHADEVVAVLILGDKSQVASIKISSDVKTKLQNYYNNLQSKEPTPELFDISDGLSVNAEDLVPSELLLQAVKSKGLVIIPHGLLHLISWAGLKLKEKRLFEYCPVGILPNLSCISNLSDGMSTKPKVSLIGSPDYSKTPQLTPLDGAEEEIENIQQIYFPNRIIEKPLMGKEATTNSFWGLVGYENSKNGEPSQIDATRGALPRGFKPVSPPTKGVEKDNTKGGILHIACHGNSDPNDPMNSGLLLTDSKIDAAQIARSSIMYDEAVLSACNTGWRPMEVKGIELVGDDILGLPGAFLEAGVKSILVSIPPAADLVTSEFMNYYHENRFEGKSPLTALQNTQKHMLTESHYKPYLWVGLTVYGCQ